MKWLVLSNNLLLRLYLEGAHNPRALLHGVAVTPALLTEILAPYAGQMVPAPGEPDSIEGIPFVVCEGLRCDAVFFTDADVWRRFLQHTDH